MPLFLLFIIYVTLNRQQWDTWELHWLIFEDAGDAGDVLRMDEGERLVIVCDVGCLIWKVKSVQIKTISLLGLEPLPYTSVALMAQN